MTDVIKKYMEIVEGDLIPFPANTFWIPNDEYEFYRIISQLADTDHPFAGMHKQDPDMVLVCSEQEVEKIKAFFDRLKLPFSFSKTGFDNTNKFRDKDFRRY